ncbi:hypothetical protein GGG16DRAFT_89756, partial [Schizophyllum commune]
MPSFILEALMTPILVPSATCDADRVLVFAMGWSSHFGSAQFKPPLWRRHQARRAVEGRRSVARVHCGSPRSRGGRAGLGPGGESVVAGAHRAAVAVDDRVRATTQPIPRGSGPKIRRSRRAPSGERR